MKRYYAADHHVACRCGCGELSDECVGPRPNPLGGMVLTDLSRDRNAVRVPDSGAA